MPPSRDLKEAPAPADGVISRQLRAALRDRGASAESLARDAGVNPTMVRRFLAGERGLKLDTVDRLAEALGLRLIEAARGKVRPAPAPKRSRATRPAAT